MPDSELTGRLLAYANEMRKAKGVPPFTYDARLEKAAQTHADDLAAGRARPHDRLEWRIRTLGGWPDGPCHMSRRGMPANYSEGIVNQGWAIDEKSLDYLVGAGPGEGHYDDFFDPHVTHVGIGVGGSAARAASPHQSRSAANWPAGYATDALASGNHLVLDYGVVCDFKPEPDPSPAPPPGRDDFDLW